MQFYEIVFSYIKFVCDVCDYLENKKIIFTFIIFCTCQCKIQIVSLAAVFFLNQYLSNLKVEFLNKSICFLYISSSTLQIVEIIFLFWKFLRADYNEVAACSLCVCCMICKNYCALFSNLCTHFVITNKSRVWNGDSNWISNKKSIQAYRFLYFCILIYF